MMFQSPYLPWQVSKDDFPANGSIAEKIIFVLRYASLAPSTFNAQPWKCRIHTGGVIEIFLDHTRMPTISDKTGRFGLISVGCFIENLIIAASYFGFHTEVDIKLGSNSKNLQAVAMVRIVDGGNHSVLPGLFDTITTRVTNRSFNGHAVDVAQLATLVKGCSTEGVAITVLGPENITRIKEISSDADVEVWSNKAFRQEHVSWVRNNLTRQFDGMPGFGVGVGLVGSFMARPVILSDKFAEIQRKKNQRAIGQTTAFLVISGQDNPEEWINVGRRYERSALVLTESGLSLAPMGHFIESDVARNRLGKLVKYQNPPQMMFRVGYPRASVAHSPRLPIEKIMV
jgi:hypothetical protein